MNACKRTLHYADICSDMLESSIIRGNYCIFIYVFCAFVNFVFAVGYVSPRSYMYLLESGNGLEPDSSRYCSGLGLEPS